MGKNHEIGSAVPMHDDTYHVNKTQSMILWQLLTNNLWLTGIAEVVLKFVQHGRGT